MSKLTALLIGFSAYLIWGLSPIYFKYIQMLPASEIVIHRIIWSAICCCIPILLMRKESWWKPLVHQPKYIVILALTALTLSGNWLLYVWAINHGYMLEASLGYYINPLLTVFLGTFFLKERMSKLQWIAIIIAAIGVMIQILLLGKLPWISLILAFSFALYGLIRKIVPIKVLPAMVVETWILFPIALIWLFITPETITLQSSFWTGSMIWLAMLAGPLTLVPLILFNQAAKHLPYSTVGFLQYTSPTLIFLLAIFYFKEPLNMYTLLTFGFIWFALLLFSVDAFFIDKKIVTPPIAVK